MESKPKAMPAARHGGRARPRLGFSLRAKMLAIIAGGILFGVIAALVLLLVVGQADTYLARASSAQHQLERLISLSGRISDYGLRAVQGSPTAEDLAQGHARVSRIFTALNAGVAEQVSLVDSETARNAAATKSLIFARMKAQFQALHRRITKLAQTAVEPDQRAAQMRASMDAFGVTFAPLLAQALEDERAGARAARDDMALLRNRVTIFALTWLISGLALGVLLYLGAGRSILSRIAETVRGASAISSGRLDERLAPSGRDELTLLMTRFNRMADTLARREERLLVAQQDLKKIVAERTVDLETANKRLEDIDTNRRRFFSDISHELRTPLTVILGEAEVSLRQMGTDTETPLAQAFRTIHARASLLRRRVDDLLRVARSESGRLDLAFQACNLHDITADAIADVSRLGQQRNISIRANNAEGAAMLSADKDWLRQVLTGLLVKCPQICAS